MIADYKKWKLNYMISNNIAITTNNQRIINIHNNEYAKKYIFSDPLKIKERIFNTFVLKVATTNPNENENTN